MRTLHVGLRVEDLERSLAFYTSVGYELVGTVPGTHRASTMPLLADAPVTGRSAAWTFIHIWRVADGMLVEDWARRDDTCLLKQFPPS